MVRHGVEFLVIGGQAEVLHGGGRLTYDIDFCYRRTADNLLRLANALRELKPTLRGAPPDLPFRIDAQSLALGSNFTFDTAFGGFDDLIRRADDFEFGGHLLRGISLDDLIRIKQHINRPKDRESLMQLLAIKHVREEQGGS